MALDMYHHAEIIEAICGVCRGSVALTADVSEGNVLVVGSNRLFTVGDLVEIRGDTTEPESHTVAALDGLTGIVLDSAVQGEYLVSGNARVSVCHDDLPELQWVGRGRPEMAPQPMITHFPCVIVAPSRMEQPVTGGTNRSYEQDYWTTVFYVRRSAAGEVEESALLDESARLFNALMADPYLGGACWYSQVCNVVYSPPEEETLKKRGVPVKVVRFDVVARRSELGPSG